MRWGRRVEPRRRCSTVAVGPVQGLEGRRQRRDRRPGGRRCRPRTRSARRAPRPPRRPAPGRGRRASGVVLAASGRASTPGRRRRSRRRPAPRRGRPPAPYDGWRRGRGAGTRRRPYRRRRSSRRDARATRDNGQPVQPLSWRFFNFTRRSRTREQGQPGRHPGPDRGGTRRPPACARARPRVRRDHPGRQAPDPAGVRRQGRRRDPRRRRRRDPRGLPGARRLRRDGRAALHPRGDLPRRRQAADPAPPLAAQRRPAGQGRPGRAATPSPAGSPRATTPRPASTSTGACARSRTPTSPRRWCRSSSTAPRRRRPDGHRPEHPADAGAGEGDLVRRPRRGDRAGPAHGVPQDAGRPGAGAGRAGPQDAAT